MASNCKCKKCFTSLMPTDSVCYECEGRVTPPGFSIPATSSINSEFECLLTIGNSEQTDSTADPLYVENKFSMPDTGQTIFGPAATKNSDKDPENAKAPNAINFLNLEAFYPKRLSWIDVVKLRGPNLSKGLSVVQKLMMSDYRAHFSVYSTDNKINNDSDVKSSANIGKRDPKPKFQRSKMKSRTEKTDTGMVHPMDVMNAIYNCCDRIVLQTLMDRLFICRLAIPLIFLDTTNEKPTFLLWSLRGIVPNSLKEELPLVDIPQQIISFLRFGRLVYSKSKLLNELLSSNHHDTFFNRDCEKGMLSRFDSNGNVETSWYFPSGDENMSLKNVFTILNLRGDANTAEDRKKWIFSVSNLCFCMVDLKCLNSFRFRDNFSTNSVGKFVVCIMAETFGEVSIFEDKLGEFHDQMMNDDAIFHIIHNFDDYRLLSAGELKIEFQEVIHDFFQTPGRNQTLVNLADVARQFEFCVDEDDEVCRSAYTEAAKITDSIHSIGQIVRKPKLLPLHGKLWKHWGELKKEQYRTKISQQQTDIFVSQKEEEQLNERKSQFKMLGENLSPFLISFISQVQQKDEGLSVQYFIHWMQLILNNWSREVMPELQNNYYKKLKEIREKWSNTLNESVKTSLKNELDNLRESLENASFGLEHILRELGQMFEAFQAVKQARDKNIEIPRKLEIISTFPRLMAKLILHGVPLELMDGDAAFVPLTWVKAVFKALLDIIGDAKLFIISVVGIQSSGKSTLLNTMFGLKFAVSAGRCTRGLYCLLIPVDKQSLKVAYDYIMIIDTEGLRAPELQDVSQLHDNELATFVIGLGDVTIVNIKGENVADINDVLQIVIHAMIRISLVKPNLLKPSCLFIHQNVPAIDAGDKLRIEQEKLLSKLDKITAAAAEEENVSGFQHFKDVIIYKEHNYVYYMPDLWQGQPPMAPANRGYSEKVNTIKNELIGSIGKNSNPTTMTTLIDRISDLWEAIISENFVFSFKNSEEVKAFTHLDRNFMEIVWELNERSLNLQIKSQSIIPNIDDKKDLVEQQNSLTCEITASLAQIYNPLQNQLKTYFDTNENRAILEQWRGRYTANLENLFEDEKSRLQRMLRFSVDKRICQLDETNKLDLHFKERITETAMQAGKELRRENKELSDKELLQHFEKKFPEWLKLFGTVCDPIDPTAEILNAITNELHEIFNDHKPFLSNELKKDPLKNLKYHFFDYQVLLNPDDLDCNLTWWEKFKEKVNLREEFVKECLLKATNQCRDALKKIEVQMKEWFGCDFDPGQVKKLTELLTLFFNNHEKSAKKEYRFHHKFRVRFTIHVCKCAANLFIENQNEFENSKNPITAIWKRKEDFFHLFKDTYRNIAKENTAANWFLTELSDWMYKSVSTKLSPLIKNAVLTDELSCFETKQTFFNKILIDIAEQERFEDYISYINDQEKLFNDKVKEYISVILNRPVIGKENKTKLEAIVENEGEKYFFKISQVLDGLKKSFDTWEEYYSALKQMFDQKEQENTMEKYPTGRLSVLGTMEITDFRRFTDLLIEQLPTLIKQILHIFAIRGKKAAISSELVIRHSVTDAHEMEKAYDSSKLYSNIDFPSGANPVDLISQMVLGCTERCPFCLVPCKFTTKKHGLDHNALQHSLNGLKGGRWYDTKKMTTFNCPIAIASGFSYLGKPTKENPLNWIKYSDYKKYHEDWEIAGDRSVESSLYWKWFMNKFQTNLLEYFQNSKKPDIPDEWTKITWDEAKKSLLTYV